MDAALAAFTYDKNDDLLALLEHPTFGLFAQLDAEIRLPQGGTDLGFITRMRKLVDDKERARAAKSGGNSTGGRRGE